MGYFFNGKWLIFLLLHCFASLIASSFGYAQDSVFRLRLMVTLLNG